MSSTRAGRQLKLRACQHRISSAATPWVSRLTLDVTSHTCIQLHHAAGDSHLDRVRRDGDHLADTHSGFCGMPERPLRCSLTSARDDLQCGQSGPKPVGCPTHATRRKPHGISREIEPGSLRNRGGLSQADDSGSGQFGMPRLFRLRPENDRIGFQQPQ